MNCLEIIHSQEALVDIETSAFPTLRDSKEKTKILKKYEKIASTFQKKDIVNIDDMVGKLNGR